MAEKKSSTKKTTTKRATPAKASTARKEALIPKQEKPIFRAGTWVTILILAALIGFAIYLNRGKKPGIPDGTPASLPSPVFSTSDGDPISIDVKPSQGNTQQVKIARNAEKVWAIELPAKAEANQALSEAAATQVSALKIISPITADPSIFGLDKPAYVITIEFAGGKKHTLEIGDHTPTNSGYYVRIDKDKMAITDLSGIDSLLQLGTFPPYLNTPTPTALPPTETPVPAPTATEVPVTPTP